MPRRNLSRGGSLLLIVTTLLAGGVESAVATTGSGARFMLAAEHLEPTEADRQLDTTSIDLLFPFKSYDRPRLTLLAGLTATRASGHITQLLGELEQGTLRRETYDSPGTGIGPSFLASLDFARRRKLSLPLGVGGALILYDQDFPAGGERYNFMWRLGPSIAYRVSDSYVLGAAYRWMHVSNGKGYDRGNPSYDARGICVLLARTF